MNSRPDSVRESAVEEQPKVVVRDKRRIDPVTGEIRVPPAGGQQTTGGGSTAGSVGGHQATGGAGGGVQVDDGTGGAAPITTDELDALRSQLAERTGDLQRITAEYSNYRRRVERDRQAVVAFAKAQVAGELLTVLDDIERAEAHGDLSGAFKAVADKLVAGLTAHGLEAFGATGDAFDPEVHQAVQHSTSPEVQGPTVTAVLRRGYRFGDRVLRPAMVAVTDAEPGGSADSAEPQELSRDAARFGGAGTDASGDPGAFPGDPGMTPGDPGMTPGDPGMTPGDLGMSSGDTDAPSGGPGAFSGGPGGSARDPGPGRQA